MANLLFLVHRLPFPPNKGDKVRSYRLLKHFAREHRVFLGTFIDDPADEAWIESVRPFCHGMHVARLKPVTARARSMAGLVRGEPLTVPYFSDAGLRSWVRQVVAENDIGTAFVFSSAMAQYVADMESLRLLTDFIDVDSHKWSQYAAVRSWPLSWIYRREGRRLLAYERAIADRSAQCFFVTAAEKKLFLRFAPEFESKVQIVGNGVDVDYFAPDAQRTSPYAPGELPIVFTGAMDYWPNIDAVRWFAEAVLPSLRKRWSGARFYIVGMRPAASVSALAGDAVVVTGTVRDVRPYLQHAAVAVAPLRVARGIQNKILEGMAMGLPVVTSRFCADAVEGATDKELVLADSADEFVQALSSILAAPESASTIGAAARKLVVDRYSWEQRLKTIDRYLANEPEHSRLDRRYGSAA